MRKTIWPDRGSIYSMLRERAHQCLLRLLFRWSSIGVGSSVSWLFHPAPAKETARGWKSVLAELSQGVGSWEGAAAFLQGDLATSHLLHVYLTSLVLLDRRLTSTSVFYRASVVYSLPVEMPLFPIILGLLKALSLSQC